MVSAAKAANTSPTISFLSVSDPAVHCPDCPTQCLYQEATLLSWNLLGWLCSTALLFQIMSGRLECQIRTRTCNTEISLICFKMSLSILSRQLGVCNTFLPQCHTSCFLWSWSTSSHPICWPIGWHVEAPCLSTSSYGRLSPDLPCVFLKSFYLSSMLPNMQAVLSHLSFASDVVVLWLYVEL